MFKYLVQTLEMIKFSHTLFAMPFACLGMILAFYDSESQTILWNLRQMSLIILACVFARSAAMGFNRWADAEIDAKNPRTCGRHLPTGILSRNFVLCFVVLCSVLFSAVAFLLNTVCGWLSFPTLLVLLGYSYTKRFTGFCHFVLGFALAIAPSGAWIAVRGDLQVPPVLISLAVLCWTAGFDMIYSCMDQEVDRREHLFSFPAVFGVQTTLWISRLMYVMFLLLLLPLPMFLPCLGVLYYVGLCAVALLFIWQHAIVKPSDLRHIEKAFFTINGWVGVVVLFASVLSIYCR